VAGHPKQVLQSIEEVTFLGYLSQISIQDIGGLAQLEKVLLILGYLTVLQTYWIREILLYLHVVLLV
jgi:hypothetical protein